MQDDVVERLPTWDEALQVCCAARAIFGQVQLGVQASERLRCTVRGNFRGSWWSVGVLSKC